MLRPGTRRVRRGGFMGWGPARRPGWWRAKGTVAPLPQGRVTGTAGKLAPHRAFLVEVVQAEPEITLRELAGALREAEGVTVNPSSLHRALKAARHAYKKRPDRVGA